MNKKSMLIVAVTIIIIGNNFNAMGQEFGMWSRIKGWWSRPWGQDRRKKVENLLDRIPIDSTEIVPFKTKGVEVYRAYDMDQYANASVRERGYVPLWKALRLWWSKGSKPVVQHIFYKKIDVPSGATSEKEESIRRKNAVLEGFQKEEDARVKEMLADRGIE